MGPVIVIIQYLNLFDLLTFSINMDRSAQGCNLASCMAALLLLRLFLSRWLVKRSPCTMPGWWWLTRFVRMTFLWRAGTQLASFAPPAAPKANGWPETPTTSVSLDVVFCLIVFYEWKWRIVYNFSKINNWDNTMPWLYMSGCVTRSDPWLKEPSLVFLSPEFLDLEGRSNSTHTDTFSF